MNIIIIKIGSNIIKSKSGLDEKRMKSLAKDISKLYDMGYQPVIVSSGAIAAGKGKIGFKGRIHDIKLKQALAAIGQSSLIWAYEKVFSSFDKKVAQILLTRDVFSDRRRYINSKDTIVTLLTFGVIPIINENDTVAIDEIKFGDNDQLAALVASLLEARRLVILSDINGLYTDDPQKNKNASLIHCVNEITPEVKDYAKGTGTIDSTGGMYSKVIAAKMAVENGIMVNILSGRESGLILSLINGGNVGTTFMPKEKKFGARKGWIAYGIRAKGSMVIDDGAVDALINKGKSLLPSGIKSFEGVFDRGDAVNCVNVNGKKIAKGLIDYSATELIKIIGKKTSQIEKLLGYKYSDEVIHRDNMTLV